MEPFISGRSALGEVKRRSRTRHAVRARHEAVEEGRDLGPDAGRVVAGAKKRVQARREKVGRIRVEARRDSGDGSDRLVRAGMVAI
jgi:hypothetical protein